MIYWTKYCSMSGLQDLEMHCNRVEFEYECADLFDKRLLKLDRVLNYSKLRPVLDPPSCEKFQIDTGYDYAYDGACAAAA